MLAVAVPRAPGCSKPWPAGTQHTAALPATSSTSSGTSSTSSTSRRKTARQQAGRKQGKKQRRRQKAGKSRERRWGGLTGEDLALQQLQAGAAAGGDVAHLLRHARLLHRRHRVAAADDGDAVVHGSQLVGDGKGALGKGVCGGGGAGAGGWQVRGEQRGTRGGEPAEQLRDRPGRQRCVRAEGGFSLSCSNTAVVARRRCQGWRRARRPAGGPRHAPNSNTPMGPFQMTVFAPLRVSLSRSMDLGPMSRPWEESTGRKHRRKARGRVQRSEQRAEEGQGEEGQGDEAATRLPPSLPRALALPLPHLPPPPHPPPPAHSPSSRRGWR